MTEKRNRTVASSAKEATSKVVKRNATDKENFHKKEVVKNYSLSAISLLIMSGFLYVLLEKAFTTPTGDNNPLGFIFGILAIGATSLCIKSWRASRSTWIIVFYICFMMLACNAAFSDLINRFVSDIFSQSEVPGLGNANQTSSFDWILSVTRSFMVVGIAFMVFFAENAIWQFFEKAELSTREILKCKDHKNQADVILELADSSENAWNSYHEKSEEEKAFDRKRFLATEVSTMLENKIIDLDSRRRSSPDLRTVPQARLDSHKRENIRDKSVD